MSMSEFDSKKLAEVLLHEMGECELSQCEYCAIEEDMIMEEELYGR